MKSRRPGRNADQIQYETARKIRSTISNFIHTTLGGVGLATTGSGDRSSMFFLGSPTNSLWFKRFMMGCHRRMGDVWIPDRAVTVEIVLALLDLLDEEFKALQVGQRRLEVCLTGALIVAGYTAALHGEELPQIDVGMLCRYWEEGRDYTRKPHVPLTLIGRFKQTKWVAKNVCPAASTHNFIWHTSAIVDWPINPGIQSFGSFIRATVSSCKREVSASKTSDCESTGLFIPRCNKTVTTPPTQPHRARGESGRGVQHP
ncbi:hypothetical protein ACA910_019631 [Epithemia clementina (nom. ined.)]